MGAEARPGPKPRRIYVRIVRLNMEKTDGYPDGWAIRRFLKELARVGRLVAQGPLSGPPGDVVLLRAHDRAQADRAMRNDPFRGIPDSTYDVFEWTPKTMAAGVNLDPAPPLGSGRLTQLQRVSVVVRDLAAAIRWYSEVLGLSIRVEEPETGYVELSLGRGAAALSLVAPRREWGEPYYSEGLARLGARTGIAFETDSVSALELRLRHAKARITQSAEPQPWGGLAIRFADPDGNEFLAFESATPHRPPARRIPSG